MSYGKALLAGLVGVVVAGCMALCVGCLWYGYLCLDALYVQPSVTAKLASEAVGPTASLSEFCDYGDDYHRYIYAKDGKQVDVYCRRGQDGNWAVTLTEVNR